MCPCLKLRVLVSIVMRRRAVVSFISCCRGRGELEHLFDVAPALTGSRRTRACVHCSFTCRWPLPPRPTYFICMANGWHWHGTGSPFGAMRCLCEKRQEAGQVQPRHFGTERNGGEGIEISNRGGRRYDEIPFPVFLATRAMTRHGRGKRACEAARAGVGSGSQPRWRERERGTHTLHTPRRAAPYHLHLLSWSLELETGSNSGTWQSMLQRLHHSCRAEQFPSFLSVEEERRRAQTGVPDWLWLKQSTGDCRWRRSVGKLVMEQYLLVTA